MRSQDKRSGAAGALASGPFTGDEDEDESDSDDDDDSGGDKDGDSGRSAGSGQSAGAGCEGAAGGGGGAGGTGGAGASGGAGATSKSRAVRHFESRPIGSKAAKKQKVEELSMSRQMKASTVALEAIANACKE